ncbi:MAG TPA: M18 family aminopeptidase [Aeromicrobium sp.]|nr:M18 family aminopeptidase [Aeromicrobium sp.]
MSSTGADRLLRFIDNSPTPFHVVATVAEDLDAAGFTRLSERDAWPAGGGAFYVARSGSLVAWRSTGDPVAGFRIVGGHTDSPNLRLKPHHDVRSGDLDARGAAVVALEPYGGAILRSWFDRDLGVAGRIALRDGTDRLVRVDEPVLRVPHLAIHLDREAKDKDLDPQRHLNAIWAVKPADFLPWLISGEGVAATDILGFELMAFDLQPSAITGARREFVSAPRLDNQVTCFSGLEAFIRATAEPAQPVLALFDHEEVGSISERGAQSDLLATTLERVVVGAGGGRDEYHRALAASWCASGDMAHATHPNYREKHEPLHPITLGGGPVIKVNQNLRYASEARGAAMFASACEQAEVPVQRYVHRADLPCGSTIGPLSAARTGITTVDVGAPQLAMHSCREFMAAADVDLYSRGLAAFLAVD